MLIALCLKKEFDGIKSGQEPKIPTVYLVPPRTTTTTTCCYFSKVARLSGCGFMDVTPTFNKIHSFNPQVSQCTSFFDLTIDKNQTSVGDNIQQRILSPHTINIAAQILSLYHFITVIN